MESQYKTGFSFDISGKITDHNVSKPYHWSIKRFVLQYLIKYKDVTDMDKP